MEYHDKITIPDLGREAVLHSVKNAEDSLLKEEHAKRETALDFYYNQNMETHIEDYFSGASLSQIPVLPLRLVPRFAKARMMLYKKPADRYVGGELAEEYLTYTYHLNSQSRAFSELCWLLGNMHMKSTWNDRKQRVEYHLLPFVKEFYHVGESEPHGYSYEIEKKENGDRQFVFWSEDRDGEQGMHFKYDLEGRMYPIGDNTEMVNPYGINPISRASYPYHAYDVVFASLHASIAFTEVMLATRYQMGSPVITGVDQAVPDLKWGVDRLISLPEGSSMQFVAPPSNIPSMIEGIKQLLNVTGQNHALSVRWGEQGQIPSGQALKILSIENIESRESDIPLFQEFEEMRYAVDRSIIETHTGKVFDESYAVDFAETDFPDDWSAEKDKLMFMMDNGLITQKDLMRHFNPDITDAELEQKLEEVEEEKPEPAEPETPQVPAFEGLRKLGKVDQ